MPENLILYTSDDGKSSVSLYERDGSVWLNQLQMAELFATSKQNISLHINSILKDRELAANSVVNDYLTTAADGKSLCIQKNIGEIRDERLQYRSECILRPI